MIKTALIGCGKVADQHAENIAKIAGCRLVGVCDREPLMAQQLAERSGVSDWYTNAERLIAETQPHVVHITTPPQSHYELGLLCLESGCHVLIEKPFTVDAQKAERLVSIAEKRDLKITAGHNAQCSHAALEVRKLVSEGFIGSRPVHLESIFCYSIGGAVFAKALFSDPSHWIRRLPGQLLHNIISHGIGQIAEYLQGDHPTTTVVGFTSSELQSIGEKEMVDELRVIIRDERNTTAYFTFSTQMEPKIHEFRIFGDKNSLILDDDHQTVIKLKSGAFKGQLNHFLPPVLQARQYLRSARRNVLKFFRREFHTDRRTWELIRSFYRSVTEGTPLPVTPREIVLTARIMDDIFSQLNDGVFKVEPDPNRATVDAS